MSLPRYPARRGCAPAGRPRPSASPPSISPPRPRKSGSPADGAVPAGLDPVLEAVGPAAAVAFVRNGRLASVDVDPAAAAQGLQVVDAADLEDGDDLLGHL